LNFLATILSEVQRVLTRAAREKREENYRRDFCLPSSTQIGGSFLVQGRPAHPGALVVGENGKLFGRMNFLGAHGRIRIGEHCFLGENSVLWCASEIQIGNRCLISHGVNIHDTDSHPLEMGDRARQITEVGSHCDFRKIQSGNTYLEDDVWIGFNAIILKGVRIGRGSIVGAGAVVTRTMPAFSLIAGNPAKVIRAVPTS
jgi:acetyltransferase-like isoleucine patch superfamily enzyme